MQNTVITVYDGLRSYRWKQLDAGSTILHEAFYNCSLATMPQFDIKILNINDKRY